MCGRYARSKAKEEYLRLFGQLAMPDLPPSYNVAPSQQVLVAREHDGRREGVAMRWGLIPSWAQDAKKPQINARGETVADKPMFRAAFKKRRCLILADGYYEWQKSGKAKQPYYIRLKDDCPFVFAGLWETWSKGGAPMESCAIITTEANESLLPIHDRMPVILRGADAEAWLDRSVEDPKALVPLLRPFPAREMVAFPVSVRVGNVRENDAGLIEPI